MATREQFVGVISGIWETQSESLQHLATRAENVRRIDRKWFWTVLLNSFLTYGGSANLNIKRQRFGDQLTWAKICALSDHGRSLLFWELPNNRFRNPTAQNIEFAFQYIFRNGGPCNAAMIYLAIEDGALRMIYLRTFRGIGAKYSRNIPMDVRDELVLDSVALDHRLHALLDVVEDAPSRSPYTLREEYLRGVCAEVRLPDMWFLDRLLYNYYTAIKIALQELA